MPDLNFRAYAKPKRTTRVSSFHPLLSNGTPDSGENLNPYWGLQIWHFTRTQTLGSFEGGKFFNMEKPRRAWSPALQFAEISPRGFSTLPKVQAKVVGSSLVSTSVPRVLGIPRFPSELPRWTEYGVLRTHFGTELSTATPH